MMFKPTPAFKLPKTIKYQMASMSDRNKRNEFKKIMIQGILHGNQIVHQKDKKKKSKKVETETD